MYKILTFENLTGLFLFFDYSKRLQLFIEEIEWWSRIRCIWKVHNWLIIKVIRYDLWYRWILKRRFEDVWNFNFRKFEVEQISIFRLFKTILQLFIEELCFQFWIEEDFKDHTEKFNKFWNFKQRFLQFEIRILATLQINNHSPIK